MNYDKGLEIIWSEDEDYQASMLNAILESIRGLSGEPKDILFNYMKEDRMFYVPNDIYMHNIFGDEILSFRNGVYVGEQCKLCYRLAMPMRLLDDTVIGFIGYSNKDDFNEDNESFIKYLYPPKYIIQKSRYVYITRLEFLNAIKDGYICIVDGLFDQKALCANGVNAISLCGSAITEYHRLYLNSIKHKVIIADNDEAGRKMASDIKKIYPDAVEIIQDKAKDIDSFMRTSSRINEIKSLITDMKKEDFLISHKLPSSKLINTKIGGVTFG